MTLIKQSVDTKVEIPSLPCCGWPAPPQRDGHTNIYLQVNLLQPRNAVTNAARNQAPQPRHGPEANQEDPVLFGLLKSLLHVFDLGWREGHEDVKLQYVDPSHLPKKDEISCRGLMDLEWLCDPCVHTTLTCTPNSPQTQQTFTLLLLMPVLRSARK